MRVRAAAKVIPIDVAGDGWAARSVEQLWRLARAEHVLVGELLELARGDRWAFRVRKDKQVLLMDRRFESEAAARYVAQAFAQDHERTGWHKIP